MLNNRLIQYKTLGKPSAQLSWKNQIKRIFSYKDVKSLCTNIPDHEGIEAAKKALDSVNGKLIATKIIIRFLFLILRF